MATLAKCLDHLPLGRDHYNVVFRGIGDIQASRTSVIGNAGGLGQLKLGEQRRGNLRTRTNLEQLGQFGIHYIHTVARPQGQPDR